MSARPNEKSQGGNLGLISNNTAFNKADDTAEQSAKLLLTFSAIQSAQVLLCEYALETDYPLLGIVEVADALDTAHDVLALALCEGGQS
jgi:hypothetical protein